MSEIKNCIICLVDSLRFDALKPYRHDGLLEKLGLAGELNTPVLDQLLEAGNIIPNLHSPYTSTPPAVASLLSGLYPREHGLYGFQRPLTKKENTLPRLFKNAGFKTILFNGLKLFKHNGIQDLFDYKLEGSFRILIAEVERLNTEGEKVFAYFHTMDVHHPYLLSHYPPDRDYHNAALEKGQQLAELLDKDYRFKRSDAIRRSGSELAPYSADGKLLLWKFLKAAYHIHIKRDQKIDDSLKYAARWYIEGINHYDKHNLSILKDFLLEDKIRKKTVFMLSADHGETSRSGGGLQGFEHSFSPDQDLIRIPGLLMAPEKHPEVEDQPLTSLVDFAPTLLKLSGIDTDEKLFSGKNLLEPVDATRCVYSEYSADIEEDDQHDTPFPRRAFLKSHAIITGDGFKYMRMGTGLNESDYELEGQEFVERAILKVAFETPPAPLVKELTEFLKDNPGRENKEKIVEDLSRQVEIEEPKLINWKKDHFQEENLRGKNEEMDKLMLELDHKLCTRFPDPLDLENEPEASEEIEDREEQEELIESLEDLGYL